MWIPWKNYKELNAMEGYRRKRVAFRIRIANDAFSLGIELSRGGLIIRLSKIIILIFHVEYTPVELDLE